MGCEKAVRWIEDLLLHLDRPRSAAASTVTSESRENRGRRSEGRAGLRNVAVTSCHPEALYVYHCLSEGLSEQIMQDFFTNVGIHTCG
jgi:hypothetical protein